MRDVHEADSWPGNAAADPRAAMDERKRPQPSDWLFEAWVGKVPEYDSRRYAGIEACSRASPRERCVTSVLVSCIGHSPFEIV